MIYFGVTSGGKNRANIQIELDVKASFHKKVKTEEKISMDLMRIRVRKSFIVVQCVNCKKIRN